MLRLIGDGGAGRVYLAGETALERLVAVKLLRPELAGDRTVRHRFAREARAAARVTHPNVVSVFRVGETAEGAPYLIMEYVAGRTLADHLEAEGPLGEDEGRRVLAQIAAGLAAAHAHGVIHRDVRPGNVLIEEDSARVVLSDFGIAGIKETGSEIITQLTTAGEVLGSPRYLSPEQLMGEGVTEATDVYSLGIVGFELLTRELPFPEGTDAQIVRAHLEAEPRPLAELRPEVDPALAMLLERCLAKKPEHRPRAADLAFAFARPVGGEGRLAEGSPAAEPAFFPALSSFLAELERRRVYRTTVAYLVSAFAILEGADLVLPVLGAPGWVFRALTAVVLGAFPLVIVLTWIFDVNRSGVERTKSVSEPETRGGQAVHKVLQIIGLALSVLVAALVGWWVLR